MSNQNYLIKIASTNGYVVSFTETNKTFSIETTSSRADATRFSKDDATSIASRIHLLSKLVSYTPEA